MREAELERTKLEAAKQKIEKDRETAKEKARQEGQQREKERQAKEDKDFKSLEAGNLRQKAEREERDAAAASKPSASSAAPTSARMADYSIGARRFDRYEDDIADRSDELVIRRESRGWADAIPESPRVRRGSYSNYTGGARHRHRNRSADSFYDRFGRVRVLSSSFGSRPNEYGLIYTDKDQAYIGTYI